MDLLSEMEEELDRDYLEELARLQAELLHLQQEVVDAGRRVVIVFEGRDAAGKGGAILRFTQHLMPRYYRVVALPKPTELERGQWYFQRYLTRFPNPGEMIFFDRSWYNRAVVEPVMGFCNGAQYERFMNEVVQLEKMWVEDGIQLFKLWFSIDPEEQKRRLEARRGNPLKRWKLSDVDLQAQRMWERYTHYKEQMFMRTSTPWAPWAVVAGNDKKVARLESIRHVLDATSYPEKARASLRLTPDPEIVALQLNG